MESVSALVLDEQGSAWTEYYDALEIIEANALEDVEPAFATIQSRVDEGFTAIGFVSYEAAPAFDASLPVQSPSSPLLRFSIFRSSRPAGLPEKPRQAHLPLSTTLHEKNYLQAIGNIRDHLEAGDSYQVNFTHQLECEYKAADFDSLQLFAALYEQQPSPRSLFLQTSELAICSVSPELFFELDGSQISMEPMKGTRPRHSNGERDRELRQELLESEKEKAENLMIVDMVRNDLGRIAQPGTVQVDALFEIMELPSLWQQISRVSAKTEASIWQIFQALFPCASITGAPKRQSMGIIKSLEAQPPGYLHRGYRNHPARKKSTLQCGHSNPGM